MDELVLCSAAVATTVAACSRQFKFREFEILSQTDLCCLFVN